MAGEADIHAALAAQLNTLGKPTEWENVKFTPTAGVAWLRETFLPAPVFGASLGTDGFNRITGIYLIDIFAPLGEGREAAQDLFASILAAFPRGSSLTANGTRVLIRQTYRSGGAVDGRWFHVPATVEFQADVPPGD